jgi:hypothetical protein
MPRILPASALFLVPLLAAVASADPTSDKPSKGAKTVEGDKLPPGVFTGKLVSLPSNSERKFVLEVEYTLLVPKNPGQTNRAGANINRKLQQINKLQGEIARSKNPAAKMAQLDRLVAQTQVEAAKAEANQFRTISERKEIEFRAAEDWVVRYLKPPPKFDDKGKPAKYTEAELKELKGPKPDLIGYESKEADLAPGQLVRVTLGKPKEAPKAKKGAADKKDGADGDAKPKGKDADKEKPKGKATDEDKPKDKDKDAKAKPEVTLIVIVAPAPDKDSTPVGKK